MNRTEIVKLGRLVKACCPSQQFDEFTPDAWMLILASYDYEDAKAAVAAIASAPLEPGKSRYIEPGHIIGGVNRIRAKRLELTLMPTPPAGLTADAYMVWHRRTREQIAAGTYTPGPAIEATAEPLRRDRLVLEAAPMRSAEPSHVRDETPAMRSEAEVADLDAERSRQLAALEALRAQYPITAAETASNEPIEGDPDHE